MKITKRLIDDLAEAEQTRQRYYREDPPKPTPGPPATAAAVSALASHLKANGLQCPDSYREFLSVANGVKDFELNFSLLSAEEVPKPPLPSLRRGYPSLSRFIIGRSNSLEFLAFDPDTLEKGGGMEVVWVSDDGEETRYDNFSRFLEQHLEKLREDIKREENDRKKTSRKKAKR
jgi:hypothetical protein